ncbi:hypothetical protein ACFX2I_006957 [Malus domestica]
MTRSSQPVRAHISEFDDNFEQTLRSKRKVPESNPPSSSSESEFEEKEEAEKDMEVDNRTIKELSALGLDNAAPLCIQYPAAARGKTEEFELKSSLLHHIPKYHGLSMEDPNKHLKEFEVVCSSMTPVNVDGSILKMKAFPFSLLEKAKDWLYELAPGTVTSWESMKRAFLEKFFPTSRVILLRKRISGIQQEEGESFPTYYERFKSLVASCPQHQMKEELLLQYFYEGLLPIERQMLDASAGGALVDKTPTAAKTLISNRALNAQQYEGVGKRSNPRPHQVNKVSAITELQNQMANLTTLLSQVVEGPKVQNVAACGVCSMQGHLTDKCPQLIENGGWETLNAVGFDNQYQPRNDPFSNTYNPGWRDHPNFKWREPQQGQQQSGFRQQPPGFYQKPFAPTQPQAQPSQKSGSSIDNDQIFNLLTSMAQGMQNRDKKVDELEKQVGQIAEFMGQFREQGKLPSSTIANPKGGFQTVNAIMLRSGTQVGAKPKSSKSSHDEDEKLLQEEAQGPKLTAKDEQSLPPPSSPPKPAQTKIDVAKGELTMEFSDELIKFKVPEYVKNPHDVRSCFAIDVIKHVGKEHSCAPIKKDVPRCIIEEGIGVEHTKHVITPKIPNLAESTTFAAPFESSSTCIGKPPPLIPIPISTNRLLPSVVQVPNRIHDYGSFYFDLGKLNATIWDHHYPLPYIDPMHEYFKEHVMEDVPLHAVAPSQA